jgi:DNA-binding Xre family transcriptional regulator
MSADQNQPAPDVAAGQRLKELRLARNLTSQKMADRLGLRLPRYESFEKSFTAIAQGQYLGALARVLQVSPGDIVEQDPGEPEEPELSQAARECLAIRAGQRRESLRLSKTEVALEIGVTTRQLAAREARLPVSPETLEEKWEKALRVPPGWLRDESIRTPVIPGVGSGSRRTEPKVKQSGAREIMRMEG